MHRRKYSVTTMMYFQFMTHDIYPIYIGIKK